MPRKKKTDVVTEESVVTPVEKETEEKPKRGRKPSAAKSSTTKKEVTPKKVTSKRSSTNNTVTKLVDKINDDNKDNIDNSDPLSPAEYFEKLKGEMAENTEEDVKLFYDVTIKELKKYLVTGQKKAAKNLYYKAEALKKELIAIQKGYSKYVHLSTVEDYIDNVADKCVVITEMKDYERSIPDDVVDKLPDIIDVFDNFFIVFTDYTGEARAKVAKERRDKDPILFGNININGMISDKLYFIADWVDEYCDLTLDQMVNDIVTARKDTKKEDIVFDITKDDILEEIKGKLSK